MHSNLKFSVPECDLLLIAGDIGPARGKPSHDDLALSMWYIMEPQLESEWLEKKFKKWIYEQPIDYAYYTPGNHDWIWEIAEKDAPRWFQCNCADPEMMENPKIECLINYDAHYKGLKIYGTPYQPNFLNWAFNRNEKSLKGHWDSIPDDTDILLCHCPPYGILDRTCHPNYEPTRIGSKSLGKRIKEVRPKLVVFGHNHGSHGVYEEDGIKYVNASMVDEFYKLTREPIVIEL
jgi:Icc-related predicted phosphoesterase